MHAILALTTMMLALTMPTLALANTYSYTTPTISGQPYDVSGGSIAPFTYLPGFDADVGTLTDVELRAVGQLGGSATIYSSTRVPVGTLVDFELAARFQGISQILAVAQTKQWVPDFNPSVNTISAPGLWFDISESVTNLYEFTDGPIRFDVFPEINSQYLIHNYSDVTMEGLISFTLTETFTYTPVPEPSTLAAMMVGLIGIGWMRRRRI